MAKYVLIETKSAANGGEYAFEVGGQLRGLNHDVTIYLLQDGVFTARRTFRAGAALRAQAQARGIRLLADEMSLRQRGLQGERIAHEVAVSNMGELVDLMMERADKAIWH
jgi:predicted peroxiredoxin